MRFFQLLLFLFQLGSFRTSAYFLHHSSCLLIFLSYLLRCFLSIFTIRSKKNSKTIFEGFILKSYENISLKAMRIYSERETDSQGLTDKALLEVHDMESLPPNFLIIGLFSYCSSIFFIPVSRINISTLFHFYNSGPICNAHYSYN